MSRFAANAWARGAVRCVTQGVGIDLEWTDSTLDLIGQLVDLDGDEAPTERSLERDRSAN